MERFEHDLNELRNGASAHRWGTARVRNLALCLIDEPERADAFAGMETGYRSHPIAEAALNVMRERGFAVLGSGASGASPLPVLRHAKALRDRKLKRLQNWFRRKLEHVENLLMPEVIAGMIGEIGGCDAETAHSMIWEALFPCAPSFRVAQASMLNRVVFRLHLSHPEVAIEGLSNHPHEAYVGHEWFRLVEAAGINDRATLAVLTQSLLDRSGSTESLWEVVSRAQGVLANNDRTLGMAVREPYRNEASMRVEMSGVNVVDGHLVTRIPKPMI